LNTTRRNFLLGSSAALAWAAAAPALGQAIGVSPALEIDTPMAPPDWALLERELIAAHTPACEAFFARYFDDRGYFRCVERWGADDGPDDAIENVNDWPHLYRLGGDERIRQMYEKAYEGHVRQYSEARTSEVPFARSGMYFREFPVMMDWQHNGEGLSVFNLIGLGDPYNPRYRDRARRFAGFYTGEDPIAKNYDPEHKIIRSMFNGSRGPLMRKATALDWTGDPIDLSVMDPSAVLHGEHSYEQMLAHFKDYTDTTGDNPLNLESTTLALNAYMLAHEAKYRDWLLEYVDAWVDRARRNNDMIPTNIGYDGTIGGEAGGKWYGGTYGWAFSPIVPQTGKREDRNRIPFCVLAFMNAYLLTGDDKYLDVWRRQADHINANMKTINGVPSAPYMYGDDGWYGYRPGKWNVAVQDIYVLTMKPSDRARAPDHPWLLFLEGKNPGYPAEALRAGLEHIRRCGEAMRADRTTADTRLADTVMDQNPASVTALIELMEGGLHIGRPGWSRLSPSVGGAAQFGRLRYFDPVAGRPGIPEDVAALVETMTANATTVTLVNTSQAQARTVTIQGGAYGEHQILAVSNGGRSAAVNARAFTVRLAPGAGATLSLAMKRYANQPTLAFPWLGDTVDTGRPRENNRLGGPE
jgi:hypothetical protein